MAGRSKSNGEQTRALFREMRSMNARLDRALALADRQAGGGLGVAAFRPAPAPSAQYPAPALSPLVGAPGFGLPSAPVQATPQAPGIGRRVSGVGAIPDTLHPTAAYRGASATATYGVPGTPITSGFLVDLGEYNPELMGRNAVTIYEQMRRGDAQVRATLAAVKLPIQSAKWDVVPAEKLETRSEKREGGNATPDTQHPKPVSSTGAGKTTSAKAREVADFVKDNLFGGLEFQSPSGGWISQSWDEVVRNALLMLDFGCAIHEDVYTVDGDRIRLRKLASRLPLTFYRWHTDPAAVVPGCPIGVYDDGETLYAVEQYGYRAYQFLNVLLPADKIARFTYQQEGANFWGIPLARAMYPHWYVKSALYRIDAIANERNALGIPTWKLSPGFSKQDRDAAFNFVTQLATHEATGVVEPPGDQNTGLRIVGYEGRLRDVMPSIQHHNTMISRAALAMFMELGQEGKGGSRALGKEHGDFFMLSLQNVGDQIALGVTSQTVRRLVALNFGDDAPVPRVVCANVQARSLEDIADALQKFAVSGLLVSEDNLRKFIREELALPEESTKGVVAIKGEAVAEPGGAEVAGRGAAPPGGEEPGSQKSKGKSENAKVAASDPRPPTPDYRLSSRAPRDQASAYWHGLVAKHELHTNFRKLADLLDGAETKLAEALRRVTPKIIRHVAGQTYEQLRTGKEPSEFVISHPHSIDEKLRPIIQAVYSAVRSETKDELTRAIGGVGNRVSEPDTLHPTPLTLALVRARHGVPLQATDLATAASPPDLVVHGLVQDVLNRYAGSAANLATSLRGVAEAEIDEDLFVSALHRLSDGFLDRAAAEGVREAGRFGRSDGAKDSGIGSRESGVEVVWRRSALLDEKTCPACFDADGQVVDGPDADLSTICEGQDACRCMPVADLS